MNMKVPSLLLIAALALTGCSPSATKSGNDNQLSPDEALSIATDAYVYGYSLITTEITRVQMSNVPKAEGLHAPMNQFINVPRYPPANYRGVSAPNADTLAKLMGGAARPAAEDAPLLSRISKIGIMPGQPFDMSKLDPAVQGALKDVNAAAMKRIADNKDSLGQLVNGWLITKGLGVYGTNYVKRAVVAAYGWPANLELDAVYPYSTVDSAGKKLTGANKYTLTFPKGQTPPVNGFWSITMYEVESDGWWFVPNPLNKFTVSPRNNLKSNADGSVTLYFQNESPGKDKEANWLPAPKGEFIPMLRMYWPKPDSPSILDGSWKPPAVQQVQ